MDEETTQEVMEETAEQPTEAEASETTENEGAEPSQEQATADAAAETEKKDNKVQKRIDEITRARRQAEAEAEYWRKVATGEIKPPQPQKEEPQGDYIPPGYAPEPKLESFEDYETFTRALTKWEAGRLIAERDHKAQQAQAQAVKNAVMTAHDARVAAAREKYTDYDEAFEDLPPVNIPDLVFEAILDSDQSAEIGYHLAKNPAEAKRISALSVAQQIKEIARLEDKLKGTSQPTKRISQAPAPINPAAQAATATTKDPNSMTDEEWLAYERARLAKLGRRY